MGWVKTRQKNNKKAGRTASIVQFFAPNNNKRKNWVLT